MSAKVSLTSEAATRARRIDPRLVAQGWHVVDHDPAVPTAAYTRHAVRELPTAGGWKAANDAFAGELGPFLERVNEAVAA